MKCGTKPFLKIPASLRWSKDELNLWAMLYLANVIRKVRLLGELIQKRMPFPMQKSPKVQLQYESMTLWIQSQILMI